MKERKVGSVCHPFRIKVELTIFWAAIFSGIDSVTKEALWQSGRSLSFPYILKRKSTGLHNFE